MTITKETSGREEVGQVTPLELIPGAAWATAARGRAEQEDSEVCVKKKEGQAKDETGQARVRVPCSAEIMTVCRVRKTHASTTDLPFF